MEGVATETVSDWNIQFFDKMIRQKDTCNTVLYDLACLEEILAGAEDIISIDCPTAAFDRRHVRPLRGTAETGRELLKVCVLKLVEKLNNGTAIHSLEM